MWMPKKGTWNKWKEWRAAPQDTRKNTRTREQKSTHAIFDIPPLFLLIFESGTKCHCKSSNKARAKVQWVQSAKERKCRGCDIALWLSRTLKMLATWKSDKFGCRTWCTLQIDGDISLCTLIFATVAFQCTLKVPTWRWRQVIAIKRGCRAITVLWSNQRQKWLHFQPSCDSDECTRTMKPQSAVFQATHFDCTSVEDLSCDNATLFCSNKNQCFSDKVVISLVTALSLRSKVQQWSSCFHWRQRHFLLATSMSTSFFVASVTRRKTMSLETKCIAALSLKSLEHCTLKHCDVAGQPWASKCSDIAKNTAMSLDGTQMHFHFHRTLKFESSGRFLPRSQWSAFSLCVRFSFWVQSSAGKINKIFSQKISTFSLTTAILFIKIALIHSVLILNTFF